MAIVKNAAQAGTFETVENEAENVQEQAVSPTATDAVKVEATVALAQIKNTAVGAVGKFSTVLADLENALPAVDFGVLPRFKANAGMIFDGDNAKVGDTIKITLISFNDQYVITPGVDDDEATKFVKYSADGITVDGTGQLVSEYINQLVTVEGYKLAEVKQYVELIGILNAAELAGKDSGSEHIGNMVQVSCSPVSRKSFEAYRIQRSVKVQMGREDAATSQELVIRATAKTYGKFNFTAFAISDK
jgi:hypothetical protein